MSAGDAAFIVDAGLPVFIHADGIHSTGRLTGPLDECDGMIGTGGSAFSTLDTGRLIDHAFAVDKPNRALGADALARGGQTALTEICDLIPLGRAGVAGIRDDADERRLIILLRDGRVIHSLGQQCASLHGPEGQAHRQSHPFARNRALEKHGFPVQRAVAGNDAIWNVLHLGIVAGIGHPGDLGKDFFANIGDQGRDAAHSKTSKGELMKSAGRPERGGRPAGGLGPPKKEMR